MKHQQTVDLSGRFRLAHSLLGLLGCTCVCVSLWTPRWLGERGLWTPTNDTSAETENSDASFLLEEMERVCGVLAFLMAVSAGVLCLVFSLCWTSKTPRSYSNMRSLLLVGQVLYPSSLLLVTLTPTGFMFLLTWSIFTRGNWDELSVSLEHTGFSYWLGALGWLLLLTVVPGLFLVEHCVVPDPLPELRKEGQSWWHTPPPGYGLRSVSQSSGHWQALDRYQSLV